MVPDARKRFAIVLGLDDSASAAVRQLTQRIEFARLPASAPGTDPRVPTSTRRSAPPPHVTLAAYSAPDAEPFRPLAAALVARTHPIACTLASVGAFATAEGVLFLAPAASADLVQLQLEVLERLRTTGAEVEPYWLPGQWVPHCTLAIGFSPEMLAAAIARIVTDFQPIAGQLVRLSVIRIEPPEFQYEFALGQR